MIRLRMGTPCRPAKLLEIWASASTAASEGGACWPLFLFVARSIWMLMSSYATRHYRAYALHVSIGAS